MSDTRTQLHNIIESGRSIALDCYEIGKTIADDDPVGKLFKNDILNKSVVFKRFEAAEPGSGKKSKVDTTIYFPYDFENVYGGGESLRLSDAGFQRTIAEKICNDTATKEVMERIAKDISTLHMLSSLHSLDPFVFRSKAEQLGINEEIHESYFAISKEEWASIRRPIREKISRLVTKAIGGGGNEASQDYVEKFLQKIWQAKDVEGIEPFIKAMQIEPEHAPEVFFAWKAVCYYQVRFDEILEDLKLFFQWIGDNKLCYPSDFAGMTPPEEQRLKGLRERLREKMRGGYVTANTVLAEYENSYNRFVIEDHPQEFMGFLQNADASYLALATEVSNAAHAISLWKMYLERYGNAMPREQFMELFDGLTHLYDVKHVGEVKSWDTEAAE